jgi:hypothetical protein
MARIVVGAEAAGKTCPYCRFPLKPGLSAESCDSCGAVHHEECWEEGGGCSVFGCSSAGSVAQSVATATVSEPPALEPDRATFPSSPSWQAESPVPQFSYQSGVVVNGLPAELWVVIGLLVAAGVYLIQLSLRALPDAIRLFKYFPHSLAFVLLVLLLLIGALGVGLLALGWKLRSGNRVARGLTYVAVACLCTAVLFGTAATTGEVLSMIGGLASAAILALSPAVKPLFTGEDAPGSDQPSSVIVARVSLAIWILLLSVAAVLDFCLATVAAKFAVIGIFELVVAVGGMSVYRRLAFPDRRARLIVTWAAAIAFVLLLLGRHDTGFALLLGLTASIPICLWIPKDARAFFGDQPIVVTRQGEL